MDNRNVRKWINDIISEYYRNYDLTQDQWIHINKFIDKFKDITQKRLFECTEDELINLIGNEDEFQELIAYVWKCIIDIKKNLNFIDKTK